jgi:O-antigen ligase
VTLLAAPDTRGALTTPLAAPEPARRTHGLRAHADLAALLLALAALMGPVAHGGGGRDRHLLVLGLLSLLPAITLGRVWRLGWRSVLLALGPGLGALVVCSAAPTGWAGAGDVGRFFYAGLLWLAVRAIVDRPARVLPVLVVISLGGLWQFEQAYLAWWGRGDAAHAMSGTFYAPNVFAGYMAGAGLSALALAVAGSGPLRLAGWIAAPFCLSAVLFSTSRSCIVLTTGAAGFALLVLLLRRQWRQLGRTAAVLGAAAALAALLSSSLLMTQGTSALSGASNKNASQSVSSSGGVRLEWWDAAVHIGEKYPVTGAGFGSFGSAEARFQRADTERSTFAHNLLLQAWADGGLALALPVCLAVLLIVCGLLRRVPLRDAAGLAGVIGAGVMLLHAQLDVDAQYPACLGLAAAIAALALSGRERDAPTTAPRRSAVRAGVVLVAAVIAVLAAVRFDVADLHYRKGEITGGAWTGADGPFRDARFDVLRLKQGRHDSDLLQRTERLQWANASAAWARARALAASGDLGGARSLAAETWRERASTQPGAAIPYAEVLALVGDRDAASHLLVTAYRAGIARPTSGDEPLFVLDELVQLGRSDVVGCLLPTLPARLQNRFEPVAAANCQSTLRPFDTGVGS